MCHVRGTMETNKESIADPSNIADLLQKIGCDDLIPRFEDKCTRVFILIIPILK